MKASPIPDYSAREKQRAPGLRRFSLEAFSSGGGRGWLKIVIPVMLSVVSNPDLRAQGFSAEDSSFADSLVRDLRYFDTARRWFAEKRQERGVKPEMMAEIDSRLIDILQAEGKGDEALEALAEFKKKWPSHPRAALGSLERLGAAFSAILQDLEKAGTESDKAKSDALQSKASGEFKLKVEKPLAALIVDLNKQAKAAKGKEGLTKTRLFYQAELARINIYLVYARSLAAGAERDSYLKKGLDFADFFVNERDEFYIMRYEAQIQKGLYLLEMERFLVAAEELELIFDIEPFARPPFSPQLLKAFHTIRLKAYLFSAKAYNGAKKPEIAVGILKPIMRSTPVPGDPFAPAIGIVESDSDLQQFAVLARLEYGIALADAGDAPKGMAVIHAVISKYDKLFKESEVDKYRAFVIDARKALGRVSSSGNAALSGRDYYQAAIGLKSELKLEGALHAFQTALAKLSGPEVQEYAPLCLNEIGELSFILNRFDEAAVAFSELADHHSSSKIFRSKAATSFAASVDKAKRAIGESGSTHAGYVFLTAKADEFSLGDTKYQVKMSEAGQFEEQGDFAKAREAFLAVPRDDQGVPVSYYLRAQARGLSTLVREYEAAGEDEAARSLILEAFKEGTGKLQAVLDEAIENKDLRAAGVAALGLGQMYYHLERYSDAVNPLKFFTKELKEDKYYRCTGLGYLVLSMVRAGQGKEAGVIYADLRSDCAKEPSVATAAYVLSDDADAAGDSRKAAIYLLQFAEHPSTRNEMNDLMMVMKIVKVLSDGRLTSDAKRYVEKAKKIGGGASKLGRELLLMEGQIAMSGKDWKAAIAIFQRYVKEYEVKGANYEDPFVCKDLAWATIMLARQIHPKPRPLPLDKLKLAEQYYGHAFFLLHNLINTRRVPNQEPDPALVRDYWKIALLLQKVRYSAGKVGDAEAFGEIHKFVNENQARIRAESELWSQFLKYWKYALNKMKDAGQIDDPEKFLKVG